MLNRSLPFAMCVTLIGCASLDIYYKPGVSVTALERQTLSCEVQALKDAPVSNQQRIGPSRFVPPREVCSSSGVCTTYPGYWDRGEIYTVDVNAPLRGRVEAQCMGDAGFKPVEIPPCPASIKAVGRTNVLPELTGSSCVIRNQDGGYLIVNKG